MKFKFGIKQIVLLVVAVVLIAALVAGNIVLNYFSPLLHGFFGGNTVNADSEEAQEATVYANNVVQDVAEDSVVLLKNDEVDGTPYLPLSPTTKFNLFGWGATDHGFLLVGGGSGGTNITAEKDYRVTLREAFVANNIEYNETLTEAYNAFSDFDADYRSGGSTGADVTQSLKNPAESWYTSELMTQAYNYSHTAVVVLSRWGAENGGNGELKNIGSYSDGSILRLTTQETAMFNKLREYHFDVTVLLNTTNPLELGFLEEYDDIIHACLYVGIPGQSGAMAIPNLLVGSKIVTDADGNQSEVQISPSGRLSDTYAYSWKNYSPNYNNVGVTGNIAYKEGIYIGYKWYETADVAGFFTAQGTSYDKVVQYPFGHGLSYTTFSQEITNTSWNNGDELSADTTYTVTVRVTNTGNHYGKDVVQLYFTPPYIEGGIEKASINLLAFGKTASLAPGEYEDVELIFTAYDMASYDAYGLNDITGTGYELDKGQYDIKLMENAHDLVAGNKNTASFICTNGIAIENDPTTGTPVDNLFTGSNAYANMPVDGSTGVNGGVTYLSRANHFDNYAQATTPVGGTTSAATSAAGYAYDGYETNEIKATVASYGYGLDADMYIMRVEGLKPTLGQLNGSEEAALEVDSDLLELLMGLDDDEIWDIFLNQLTRDEIKELIGSSGFQTIALETLGKPRNADKDGPAGFNNNVVDANTMTPFPVFPAETLSGCSWNTKLMEEIGIAQGKIGVSMGVQGWYAPGVNLHRSPYNSRNYEYYSEDGRLSGYLAAATIKGAKDENVYCYLKHFALAESGQNSNDWYTWTTEQALRENYCKPFEIAVKVGGANAMMSAFNKVGAVWSGYNHALLTSMLREEWGFRGSVITDWNQGYMNDYGKAMKAGNNMWLSPTASSAGINFDGAGEEYAARQSVKGILYTYLDTLYTSQTAGQTVTEAPHSPLFVGLWVGANVVLGLGLVACCVFFFWSPKKKVAVEETEAEAEMGLDEGD